MSVSSITPLQLRDLFAAGAAVDLIDVRTPAEFREVHVEFARNVPLDRLDPAAVQGAGPPGEPLYVICRSGSRGRQACEKIRAAGGREVINVEGGTLACLDVGLPVVHGQKTMSLERQVRIAAGLLIVVGALLAWVAHPVWVGLCAVIGAGLAYAGLTDSCAMGMCMARMPWNRVRAPSGTWAAS